MNRLGATKEERTERCLEVLQELHKVLSYTSKISMIGFARENGISAVLGRVLSELGIIENMGMQGRFAEWRWMAEKPTMYMANEVQKRLPLGKEKKKMEYEVVIVKREPMKIQQVLECYEVKLLFGWSTLRIRPLYKDSI